MILLMFLAGGGQLALAAVSLQISAEATPPGDWKIRHRVYSVHEEDDGMSHSTHSDPVVIEGIAKWLLNLRDKDNSVSSTNKTE